MTMLEEIAVLRKMRHEAIVQDIKTTTDSYLAIARKRGVSEATVKTLAREYKVRRLTDKH
jgi:hypothetical protein